jgi:hypothetical protein
LVSSRNGRGTGNGNSGWSNWQPPQPRRTNTGVTRPAAQWRNSGWLPQNWSVKRGLAVGASGFVLLTVLGSTLGGCGNGTGSSSRDAADSSPTGTDAAAVTVTTTPPTTSAAPSPTQTLTVLPDLAGTTLRAAQDKAQALGFQHVTSHDLTGKGRTPTAAGDWRVCSQTPGAATADPAATTVTFNVVLGGESCSLRVQATPSAAPKPKPKAKPSPARTYADAGGSSSGGSSGATCAPHTVGTCAADSPHPAGATAKCNDGSYSYSAHFSGTCSHHKGVRYWYK